MIHAYDKLYLAQARTSLARMLDFAHYDLQFDIGEFFDLFISSGIAKRFGKGDISIVAGRSGVEIAYEVMISSGITAPRIKPRFAEDRSPEYWTGWALAYYQWETGLQFETIVHHVPIEDIREMYAPYHEMDIRQFVDQMDELIARIKPETNLKILRTRVGLSQRQLSEISGVPFRTIQQYEQRQKNINKAQAEYLFMLSSSLYCEPKDLMERIT